MDARLEDLFATALLSGLQRGELKKVSSVDQKLKPKHLKKPVDHRYVSTIVCVIAFLFLLGTPRGAYRNPVEYLQTHFEYYVYNSESKCLIGNDGFSIEITRPLVNCDMCKGLTEVSRIYSHLKIILYSTLFCSRFLSKSVKFVKMLSLFKLQ